MVVVLEDMEMSDNDVDYNEQTSDETFKVLTGAAGSVVLELDLEYVPSDVSSVTTSDSEMDEARDLSSEYIRLPGEMLSTWSDEDRRFSYKYNLQGILGNPHQDQKFCERTSLPAQILNFIQDKIPEHARVAVTKYFTLAVPKLMNERLAELVLSIPQNVQTELATFITEISNFAAVAGPNTVIHLGNIFERSDVLVQWLANLTSELVRAVVNIPFDGHQLLAMVSSSYVVVRDYEGENTNTQQTEAGEKSRELELPRDLPTQIRHFLNRLDESCNLDLIELVVALPQSLKEGFSAILGQAPPNILDIIVSLFDTIGCYDIEAEQIENPEAEDINFDIYATLGQIDQEWLLIRWLDQLPDAVLAPFWQVAGAGHQLCLCIAKSELVMSFGSGELEATPETIVLNETYRLEVVPNSMGYSMDEAKDFVGSLRSVPLAELEEDRRECCICFNAYTEDGLPSGESEIPKQLVCGHVFGSRCLLDLLKPKLSGGFEYDTCPMCRAFIGKVTVAAAS